MGMPAPPAGRNAFGDPRTGTLYPWAMNHREEQAGAWVRQITNLQPTIARWKAVRAIRQQAARDELVMKLGGTAPTLAQHEMFLAMQDLSLRQTIYFFHAAGEVWECLLSDYEPQRRYLIRGPRGEKYVWDYSLQLDVFGQLR